MRVSCLQENLSRGLNIVGRAVSPRSTLPVLGNILLATDEGRLKLAATNLEIGIVCWIGAKVEDDGAVTAPARLLSEFVSQLPAERIDMDLSVRTLMLNLKCARYDTNIKGIDASEFPIIPTSDGAEVIRIEAETLRKMINQVAFAAATDESRPTLTGVNARFNDKRLTLAATDGFRLAVRSTELATAAPEKSEVIIPSRALTELSRIIGLLPKTEGEAQMVEITIASARNQILFHLPDVDMVSQLIDANFPNYEAIIPKSFATRTIIDTQAALRALRVANLFARDSSNIVRFQMTPGHDGAPASLTMTATSAESGDNLANLDVIIEGPEGEIAFNGRYMLDVLNVIDEPQIALETTRASAPGVVRPVGVGPEEFTCVVMPMHISR
ncbi:MAG TPA: DNA polymerase III subunit beta [Anaerolineae bacterium]|nr:DNA polymerase III subunit beta [Anaerolineae bacterium]HNU05113.1 DNA polymerase III subunit beta [Anaerolineae bacterium]